MYYLYVLTMYICLLFLPAYKSCTSPFVMGINSFIHSFICEGICAQMICIWHPFECDMGLDGTLASHIERVPDEFDMGGGGGCVSGGPGS